MNMMKMKFWTALAIGAHAVAGNASSPIGLANRMLASIEERGQAVITDGQGTALIQIGIFWQALAVVTQPAPFSPQNDALRPLLTESLDSTVSILANTTKDSELPLDRLSIGSSMLVEELANRSTSYSTTIKNLANSVELQPRNANGGLWYYDNVNNLTAYQNLSYLDGMYSYAPFAVIQPLLDASHSASSKGLESALKQLQILHDITVKPSGLLVHGYDAIKAHKWANPITGASPEVWGRSLAWYTIGVLNTLEVANRAGLNNTAAYHTLHALFQDIVLAQVEAARTSKEATQKAGVWQVVDRPGEAGNFIEASSSFMTVYSILRGLRLNFLKEVADSSDDTCSPRAIAQEIYSEVSQKYLITYANGSLSLNGTSSIASLSPQVVDYEYYVTRPLLFDSLIGTSAFTLASYEVGMLE